METGSVRIDRWLCAARIFKSRSQAHAACTRGRVLVGDTQTRPRHLVHVGDRIEVRGERDARILEVKALADTRLSPPLARELYDDHSPPPTPREPRAPGFDPGLGRGSKRDRRQLRRLRGR